MNEIRFFVPGKAQSAGSKKPFAYKSGKLGVRDDNDKSAGWKTIVAYSAHKHRPEKLLAGPIKLELIFHVARPKGHYGSGRNAGHVKSSAPARPTTKPDVLKLARGVEDALTDVLYQDDAQIVDEHLHKVYSDTPGVAITVWPL